MAASATMLPVNFLNLWRPESGQRIDPLFRLRFGVGACDADFAPMIVDASQQAAKSSKPRNHLTTANLKAGESARNQLLKCFESFRLCA